MIQPAVVAVTFDGDETLWDFRSAMVRALDDAVRRFRAAGLRRPPGAPVTASWLAALRDDVARRPEFRRRPMEDIRLRAFAEAAREVGAPEGFAADVCTAYLAARHAGVRLYDDSRTCLLTLRERGVRLGLVTNGNSRAAGMGVDRLFDAIVVAAECGLHKPDPEIYRYAARQLGVPPQACVHVGDDPVEDVRAAARAGMRAVWLDRAGSAGAPEEAWRTLNGLAELPELVARR